MPTSSGASPVEIYEERLAARRAALAAADRRDRRIADARLVVALLAIAIAWVVWGAHVLPAWVMLLPVGVFAGLVVVHDRLASRQRALELGARHYEVGLERMRGHWQDGPTGERFADASHPYAADLDVVGKGSLFSMLCTAVTPMGEERLGRFLLAAARPPEVRERQAAVAELGPRLELREDLAVLGGDARLGLDTATLVRWGEAAPSLGRGSTVAIGAGLVAAAGTAVAWPLGAGPAPLALALVAVWAITRALRPRVERVLAVAGDRSRELAVLARLTARLEREPAACQRLAALRSDLTSGGVAASHRIRGLGRLVEVADARHNQLFAPVAFVLMWAPVWALAIERWRVRHGGALGCWLGAVGELEALGALATYAFEHPGDVFPELVEGRPVYEASGLAHPFLPESEAVRNDVALGRSRPLVVVSGSNMSGKSTLLRSVGVSVVMALAGAPVRARALRLSPLALGASLRVTDSVQGHVSRFYAEVQRLAQLVRMAGAGEPVLFLLDELLHGTNSHDRREGARAILSALVERGAIGLVTTHDLALASIGDQTPGAVNAHFVDRLEGDRLRFDYVLRPGVVTRSNAIALMRAVGLPV